MTATGLVKTCARAAVLAVLWQSGVEYLPAQPSNVAFVLPPTTNCDVQHASENSWNRILPETNYNGLEAGAHLRTLEYGQATISFGEHSVVRLGPLTLAQIVPPRTFASKCRFDLERGLLYLLHRDAPGDVEVQTLAVSAAVKGTDFAMSVDADGQTTVALLDGEVQMSNSQGTITLESGEKGVARPGERPTKSPLIDAVNFVQWSLYYPGVLDPDELELGTSSPLAASLAAYRNGGLLAAQALYPASYAGGTVNERLYHAALLLSVGQVTNCEAVLQGEQNNPMTLALRYVIAAVKSQTVSNAVPGSSPSQSLGYSYYAQSQHDLEGALKAAQRAVELSTNFGFAWERLAELEFSFGRIAPAERAVDRSLRLASNNAQAHALRGFLLAADNRIPAAIQEFDLAIALDENLANAWLGRGLCRIKRRETKAGFQDLQTAAALEPTRSLLRSYLGKAFSDSGEESRASKELLLARRLDTNDPTPWLYLALLKRDQNEINRAVEDLQESIKLNDNRAVYRSQLLLDEDEAVRSANLAAIYNDAGMMDVSVNEAGKAVIDDYANYSAHLFLANSFNELRDPNLINLRYETATFSEYLLANLLSPVGGSRLSPYVSQQDYSRLFDQEGPGLSSETTYLSSGEWVQQTTQYGWEHDTSYAIDAYYRSQSGEPGRVNNDIQQSAASVEVKQQLTPEDSIYVQATMQYSDSGDVNQYYDPKMADPNLRMIDSEVPNTFLGYHHEWSPGMHTLVLLGELEDTYSLFTSNVTSIPGVVVNNAGAILNTIGNPSFAGGGTADTINGLKFHSEFNAYSAEMQQIAEISSHTVIAGGRFQTGSTQNSANELRYGGGHPYPPYGEGTTNFTANQSDTGQLSRLSFYGYDQWRMLDQLWLTGGMTYDLLHYPLNIGLPPIAGEERTTSQWSPKAGFVWNPQADTTVRGAYTRSLGGLFYDNSIRLEPVQVAGFNQAYRSIIPESVAGAVPGSQFTTYDLSFERNFKTRTYFVAQLELLQSKAEQDLGAFDYNNSPIPDTDVATATQLGETLTYQEKSLVLSLGQLLGKEWSVGTRYVLSDADLKMRYPGLPQNLFPETHDSALLHTLDSYAIFNHSSGFFAEAQVLWRLQHNYDDEANLAGDDFAQINLFAGYRFPQRRVEITLGLLNLTDSNYHLNPLNIYQELPRDRTLEVDFKMNF
jgi:tetratricopeptide (TPR) repeat protein